MGSVNEFPVIDGHNDLAWACRVRRDYRTDGLHGTVRQFQTDIPRMRAGGMAGQFWSVWVDAVLTGPEQVTATLEQIDFVHRLIATYPDDLQFARTASEVREAMASGKIASLLGIEGGAQIDGSLAVLRQYARMGARYMTLTWSRTTEWADSATDRAEHGGLTEFGRAVVTEMERIGVIPDLAHVAPSVMRETLDLVNKPVLVTHSGAAALCDHPRNVPDDVLTRIGDAGGTIMVAFVPSFVNQEQRDWDVADTARSKAGSEPHATVAHVADHVEHIRNVAGVHAVGIGADFDGAGAMPTGLEDVSCYQNLFSELASRGWSNDELSGLGYRNAMRVLAAHDDAYTAFVRGESLPEPGVALQPRIDVRTRQGGLYD